MLNLKEITINDRQLFEKYYTQSGIINSTVLFPNYLSWKNVYKTAYDVIDDMLCVFQKSCNMEYMYYPLGKGDLKSAVAVAKKHFAAQGKSLIIADIPCDRINQFRQISNKFVFKKDRGMYEYIYKTTDLAYLKGKNYHAKRNHINRFQREYNYEYVRMDSAVLKECLLEYMKWNSISENEKEVMPVFLKYYEKLGLIGGAIRLNKEIIAFTMGKKYLPEYAVIFVERTHHDYRGAYPVINYEFCNDMLMDTQFINREEDMCIEGLRKAKKSYYPYMLNKKCFAVLK